MQEDFYSYVAERYPELKESVVNLDLRCTFLYDEYVAEVREHEKGINLLLNRY